MSSPSLLRTGSLLALPALSCLLLAAHFLRSGSLDLVMVWLFLPGLMLWRGAWIKPVLQFALTIGMVIWIQTMMDLVQFRQVFGQPWLRMALILSGVALAAGGSVLLFETRTLRAWFSRNPEEKLIQAVVFLLTILTLGVVQAKVSFPILLTDRFFPGYGSVQIVLMALYAVWISGKLQDPKHAPLIRVRMWLFFSVVFFVQLGLGLAGWEQFLMTGALHLPVPAQILAGPIYRGEGFFMLVLFLSTVILVGPAWCSHLCYIGAWDRLASGVRKSPGKLPPWTPVARVTIFLLVMAAALGMHLLNVHWTWALTLAAVFGLLGVAIMALVSRRMGVMAHCTVFCPIGLAAVVLGKLSPWRLRIDSDCDACGRCARFCRHQALQPDDLRLRRPGLSCTLCGDCISRCRNNRLAYHFPWLSGTASWSLFITLITVLHTLFLATARI
ncbi:4Fe-4S binding protein [Desulfonatronum thiosulfatophilum]|nr:4Fe-4S binding protein [Desulfonatronum thiosulfatophilum]